MCLVFAENSPRSSGKGGRRYEGAQACLNATTKLPEFIFLSCVPWPLHNIIQHQNYWRIALQAICKSQPLGCNPPQGVDITQRRSRRCDGLLSWSDIMHAWDRAVKLLSRKLRKAQVPSGCKSSLSLHSSLPRIANDGHTRSWRTPWAGAPERDGAVDCGARRGPEGRPTGDRQNVGSDRGQILCASSLGYLCLKQSFSLLLDRCPTFKKKIARFSQRDDSLLWTTRSSSHTMHLL